jgi:hypothetical protein
MRFSDFLLVSDPADLDFIVGYADDQNIRIDVSDFFASNISGSGTPGYVPVFTSAQVIGDSVIFQHGSNIVIGGVNSLGYKLAVSGSLYASNGAVINSTISGADALRVIGGDGDIFVIPNDLGQPISSLRRINHPPAVLTTESATLGQLNSAISTLEGDIEILLDLKVDKTSVGVPNGVASLDAGGKVPLSQIPDSIIGQVQYMGTWNALTNTPTLNPLVPEEKGHYYVVSVAGVFGGVDYAVGDWIISNGLIWEKVDNTDAVTSVFGRIGAILALEADYQSFYPRLSQAYDNPTWINTLAFSKITGVPPFLLENQTITLSGDVTGSGKTSISTTISDNAVTDSKLRNSVGTSVIGRASSTTGDPADIQATTDGHVLLRSGGNLLFGLISSDSIGSIDWSKITNTPTTLSGYGITDAYTKTEADNKFVPYTGANANVNLGSNNITANSFIKAGGTSAQFLKADGSVDTSQYVPTTRSINAGTGLTGGGNLSSDVNIAFDTTWGDTRYAYRTRQLTINGTTYDLSADRIWNVGTVTSVGLSMPPAFTVSNSPVIGAGVLTVVGAGTILEYVRGDGSLATFPSLTGYVPYTGATQDVNLGTYGLISDFVRFNTSSSNIPSAEGVMSWDNTDGTVRLSVKGNTYSVPIGQSVISRVRNNTGGNLLRTNYQVVKVAGAQGQRLAVSLAQANNDLNSASTLGLVCEDISNNQEGFIVNIGQIVNVNTTGNLQGENWNDGDVLYLSPTIAGAITKVKPLAPQHTVILGYVEYAHANNGKIYVKIDNGYELEELHDVSAEPFINNGLLYRDTTLNLWKSATISTILGYTPAPQGNYITSLTGEATASGPGAASVTLSNSAVTGKVLTGLNIAGNEILSTDSILTAFGKLQHQVNQLVGGLQYEGTWNASTNTPTITSSVGTDGTFYIVSVAGTTNINGITDWQVGDWIVFHDTAWQKVDNSDSVSSVFGRVGNIVANQSDYSAFYPLIADIKNGVLTVQGTGVLSGSGTFSANQATNNTITLTHASVSRTNTTSTQTPSFGGSFNVVDSVTSSAEGHITAIDTRTVTIPSTVATAIQTGLLSSADWITFNSKQNAITLTTTGTSGPATLVGATLNIPNYAPDLSGYVTLATDQTVTGLKTIVRSGDVLNFKIGTDTLYGLKLFYSQNELVPSGEATWSFVNTFNRNGVGYETTPISFFRGVLVTGERLLSASINSNLLDYYGNNPSGRYPVYAYNTGVQQFSTGIIVGKTTGVVNPATGAIADLPAGVVANFNGRVIGGNAVNSNEFITLSQLNSSLGGYLPLTGGTLTGALNGTSATMSGSFFSNASSLASFRGNWAGANYWGIGPTATNHQLRLAMTDVSGAYLTAPGDMTFLVDGAATFSSSVTASGLASKGTTLNNNNTVRFLRADNTEMGYIGWSNENTNNSTWLFKSSNGNPIAFSPDGVNQEVIFNTDGSAFFNYPVLGSRSFVFRTVSGRPLTLETVALTGIHSLYLRPNDSGRHLISSNYLSGGVYLPLALSARENDSDLVLATSGNVLIGTTTDSGDRLSIAGNIRLTDGANRQIYIGSASNYNYRLRTDGDDFVIREADLVDRLRYSYSGVRWTVTGGLTASVDMRAPIFYDSNNTAFYIDAASTSVLNALTVGGSSVVTNNGGTWGISISGNAATASSTNTLIAYGGSLITQAGSGTVIYNYALTAGQAGLFPSGDNSNSIITLNRHPGDYYSQLGFNASGTMFYRSFNATPINTTQGWQTIITSSNYNSYSPTLTGGGASGTWGINVTGSAVNLYGLGTIQSTSTGTSYQYNYQVRENVGGYNNSNEIYAPQLAFHWAGIVASSIMMETSGRIAIRNNPGTGYENFIASTVWATSSLRSPIFYDENDSGFYVDPSGSSVFNNSITTINRNGGLRVTSSGTATTQAAIAIQQVTGEGDTIIFADYEPFAEYGIIARNNIDSIDFTSGTTANSIDSYNITNRSGSARTAYVKTRINLASGVTTMGDARAPIFYDSNDTSFYLNPNDSSTSLRIAGGVAQNNIVGRPAAYWGSTGATGPVVIKFPGGSGNYGMIHAVIDVYEYSGNAACTIIVGGHNWNGSWYNFNAQVIGQTDKPVRVGYKDGRYCIVIGNGSSYWSYGQVVLRKIQNGTYYSGIMDVAGGYSVNIESDSYSYISGDLRNLVTPQSFSAGTSIVAGTQMRAPIFFDSDDTNYYVNPASTTSLRTVGSWRSDSGAWDGEFNGKIQYHANSWYFQAAGDWLFRNSAGTNVVSIAQSGRVFYSNYLVSTNSGGLMGDYDSAGTSSKVIWTIGQSWPLANMYGLAYEYGSGYDHHLALRNNGTTYSRFGFIGGAFIGGTATAGGDFRAPIFYDSANTAYYLNPNGGSYFAGSVEVANGYFLSNGVGGAMYMTAVSGSFGGYLRTSGHMVLDQINTGYNVYVLDGNSVGVVKNAGSQSWSAFSDATIKTVHSTMENNLSKLQSITPIYYSFNNFADDKNRIGLIAQEVQEHFPELVEIEPRTDKLTLDYTGLIPVLLGAIKELKTEIETLKTQL